MPASPRSEPRPSRGARRKAETRARLLAAARTLLARQGAEATTINEITEEADVGFGSFYNHFASKEEIIESAIAEALEAQAATLDALTAELEDPAEVVAVAHRYLVSQAGSDPNLAWLLVRLDASHRLLIRVLGDRARRDIRRGIAAGRFSVPDADTAFTDTAGGLVMVMRSVLDGELGPSAERHHAEAVLRILGLAPDDAAEIAGRPVPTTQD